MVTKTDAPLDDGKHLWSSILADVQSHSALKLPSRKNMVVLGDNETGKTTLVARLQNTEDPMKGTGLEYHFIDVKDEERDDHTRLGVWILDGDEYYASLLKFALNEENFEDTIVLICASMAEPWKIKDALEQWAEILEKHVSRLKITRERMQEYKESLVRHFQEYSEPDELQITTHSSSRRHNPLHPPPSQQTDSEKVVLPLGEHTLAKNLGIPIVVIVTKTDAIPSLEKEYEYREEHFDFIQQHVRKFCLTYGASLFYTSVKEDKNCDILNRYLQHRIYGFPFMHSAYVVEKDCIFVPTGWDNIKKINILNENMSSIKDKTKYEAVISKPTVRKTLQKEAEIVAEDEQVFLLRQQSNVAKSNVGGSPLAPGASPAGSGKQESPLRTPQARNPALGPGNVRMKNVGPGPATAANEGVLANFFNSLLNKKPGAGPAGMPGSPGSVNPGSPASAAVTTAAASPKPDGQGDGEKVTPASKPKPRPTQGTT